MLKHTHTPLCTQAQYDRLQSEYEALKAARIDEDVRHLMAKQQAEVDEHGVRAAALAQLWIDEVGARGEGEEVSRRGWQQPGEEASGGR